MKEKRMLNIFGVATLRNIYLIKNSPSKMIKIKNFVIMNISANVY